jgi:uncharacterized GH25 family protein
LRLKCTIVLAFVFAFAVAASAHDTWLVARRSAVQVGQVIHLDLTSGMAFPNLDYAIKPDRVGVARYRLNGRTVEVRDFVSGPKSLRLRATPAASGVAIFWVELKPKSLELTEKLVEEYFDEINASAAIREQWAKGGPKKRWREIYTKHAKTFVGVGDASKDNSWSQPVGMALEMVPEKNPTALRSGDDFSIKVLKNGIEFGDFSIGMICQGDAKASFQKTDAQGQATFRLARAGNCLFTGTDLRPSTKPNTEWESDFSTLAIEVR